MFLECDFCGGALDQQFQCTESDCRADMLCHYEMTLPYLDPTRLLIVQLIHFGIMGFPHGDWRRGRKNDLEYYPKKMERLNVPAILNKPPVG